MIRRQTIEKQRTTYPKSGRRASSKINWENTRNSSPKKHRRRIFQHRTKGRTNKLGGCFDKCSIQMKPAIIEHPACNCRIIHHQHITAYYTDSLEAMPAAADRFENIKTFGRTAATASANGKFTDHDRNPHKQQECQINQDKCSPAKLAAEIRKLPNIPDANSTAGTNQDKSQSGTKRFRSKIFFQTQKIPHFKLKLYYIKTVLL